MYLTCVAPFIFRFVENLACGIPFFAFLFSSVIFEGHETTGHKIVNSMVMTVKMKFS